MADGTQLQLFLASGVDLHGNAYISYQNRKGSWNCAEYLDTPNRHQ
jgi:hypothetical protein